MDDLDLETFYFFVPNRITTPKWEDLITGTDPSLTVQTFRPINSGVTIIENGLLDHMGLPPQSYSVNIYFTAYPLFAYFTIWNEWFRDQNLQSEWVWDNDNPTIDSTDITQDGNPWDQTCLRVNKRHDYFTSSLPSAQKGPAVTMPLGTQAPIFTTGVPGDSVRIGNAAGSITDSRQIDTSGAIGVFTGVTGAIGNVFADLSTATAATINAIRLAFQTQKLLERDARGGSRYVEQLLSHFGVRSPDYRLQRPEYLGGSKIAITVNPIAQTAAYEAEPGPAESAVGNLGAEMHASGHKHTFTYAATEHGYILGLAVVRATPTYQQGVRRHWRRQTRLDYYFLVFQALGEQAVATQEIYQPGNNAPANATWGYQERNAEYRYTPNEITGVLRSQNATPMDWWHLAEEFASEPALNANFIIDKTQEVLARCLATAPSAQWSAQIIMDILHESTVARLHACLRRTWLHRSLLRSTPWD